MPGVVQRKNAMVILRKILDILWTILIVVGVIVYILPQLIWTLVLLMIYIAINWFILKILGAF